MPKLSPPKQSEPQVAKRQKTQTYSNDDRARVLDLLKQDRFDSFMLYDAKGSDLYEKITATPEYYLGRAEKDVIDRFLPTLVEWGVTRHILVELGSGVGEKTHKMLPTMAKHAPNGNFLYAPIDVDRWALEENRSRLKKLHPEIKCEIVQGLFEDGIARALQMEGQKTILFQGSTLGNFKTEKETVDFIKMVMGHMGSGDRFIIGVDTPPIPGKKGTDYVHDAYRQSTGGYREEFMMNILDHVNRRAGLDFHRENFKRVTTWDDKKLCVFHNLEALREHKVHSVPDGKVVASFKKGQTILMQTHHKFGPAQMDKLAKAAGMRVSNNYMCDNQHFLWAELRVDGDYADDSRKISDSTMYENEKIHDAPIAKPQVLKDRDTVVSMLKHNKFHTMFFYDAKGSQLYEKITQQPEYYLTRTEAALIADKQHEIAPWGKDSHILVELGAGVGEKTHKFLPAMLKGSPNGKFLYAPIDCDGWCLEQNKERLSKLHPEIACEILVGLYEDRLKDVKRMEGQKTILFLGSTICNFNSDKEATDFVAMVKSYMNPGDRLIIGVDTPPKAGKKSVDYVHDAYRQSTGGHREEFIMNGLDHANRRAGVDFQRKSWKRVTEWNEEESAVLHFVEALCDQQVHSVPEAETLASFKKGDRVLMSTHGKYSPEKLASIVEGAGMTISKRWMPDNEHFLWAQCTL